MELKQFRSRIDRNGSVVFDEIFVNETDLIYSSLYNYSFGGGGNVTFGIAGSTVTANAPAGNLNVSAGITNNNLTKVSFANGSGVSFGLSGSTITAAIANNYLTTAMQSNAATISNIKLSAGLSSAYLSAVTFDDAGGVSFGLNGSVITASAPAAAASPINISAGAANNNLTKVSFADSNGIQFGINASTITASHNGITSQTNQNISLYALGNTTQNSSSVLNASNLSFNAIGSLTVGYSNGSIQFSAPSALTSQSNQNISLYALGNTTQNSSTVRNASNLSLNAIGSLTIGYSNGSIQFSAPNAITSQTNQDLSLYALGNTTQNSSTVLNASKLSYNAIGSLTVGYSNGSIQFSAPNALTTQTNQDISFYAVGNTTQNSSTVINASRISFNATGPVSMGYSNGSIYVSAPSGGAQSNQDISFFALGNTTQNSSTVINASKVSYNAIGSLTVGYSNGSIQFSAPNALTSQSNQNLSFYALGANTTQNSSSVIGADKVSFSANGSLTIGYSNGTIQFSAPNALTTAALSNHSHGDPSLALTNLSGTTASNSAGLTLSLSAANPGGAANIQFFECNLESMAIITHIGSAQTRPIFAPFILPGNLTFKNLIIQMSRSVSNGSNAFTIQAGLYTYANSTSANLLGSTQNVYSAANTASVNSIRYFNIGPFGTNVSSLTPGAYILALNFSAANTLSMNYQIYGEGTAAAPVGVVSSGTDQNNTTNTSWGIFNLWGRYTAGSAGLPANIRQADILAGFTGTSTPLYPYFVLAQ